MTLPGSNCENLFLGVDGGQTSTNALIGDATGRVLASGRGGPSNHVRAALGRERLAQAVGSAVTEACEQLGCPRESIEFQAACLGFTGGITDKEAVLREVIRTRSMLVTDDVVIALAGAHEDGTGVVTIAGTGSVAMARNASGDTAMAGGWGYMFGDDGAAWGIVREALRAAFRCKEGWGPKTRLHDLFLEQSGDGDIHVFRRRLYTEDYPRPRIASFSQLVSQAAREGDEVAIEVLKGAADSLATLTGVVRDRIFPPLQTVDAAYAGGTFASEVLLNHFRRKVEHDYHVRVVEPRHNAAMGALLEAIRQGQAK
ncbi:MAG TPA: BadF/BadG/BcrA/BcrD ATPase family protein [Bryobacteraceae bacterium]